MNVRAMDQQSAKSRFSVAYLSALCAQIGCTMSETRADEDAHAVDVTIHSPHFDIPVQLKSTSSIRPRRRDGAYVQPLEQQWIDKWSIRHGVPVHVILVVVPEDDTQWVRHPGLLTELDAVAYWARFDKASTRKSIEFFPSSRLTGPGLEQIFDELMNDYFGGV